MIRTLSTAMLIVAASLATSTPCRAGQPDTTWLHCEFGPLPDRESARLHVMLVDGQVRRAVVEPFGLAGTDGSGLEYDSGNVTGTVVIGHDSLRINRSLVPRIETRMPLHLKLAVDDGNVHGTFEGTWPKPKTSSTPIPVSGRVIGRIVDADAPSGIPGLSQNAAWPGWLGPHQNFSAGEASAPLVDDLNDARLVWVSEWIGPTESGSHRYGACVGAPPCAGGASPLVWRGRIYQFRYEANGSDTQQAHLDVVMQGERGVETRAKMRAIGWTDADMRRRWGIRADEQLVCLDASNGRTLWRVDWPNEGINLFSHKCSLTNHTGVIADGKVFVFGAMGIVRCVDAETGKPLWSSRVPGYADVMDELLKKSIEQRILRAPTRSFCHALNVSGDVVLAPDGIGGCGIVALDAATGTVRWHVEGRILGKCGTPMSWSHGGADYVIAASETGTITCIESASGTVRWQYDKAGDNEYQPLLVGDLLIAHKMTRDAREQAPRSADNGPHSAPGRNYGQLACWQLTPEGPQEVWTAPAEWGAPANCPIGSAAGNIVCFRGNYSYYLVDPATGKRLSSHHLPAAVRWDEGHLLALPGRRALDNTRNVSDDAEPAGTRGVQHEPPLADRRAQDGARNASGHEPPLAGRFVLHPDSQHGHTKMFLLPARANAEVSPMWSPPHPWATTYQSAMSHAWADGRLFIRGADALYCYDLRKESAE